MSDQQRSPQSLRLENLPYEILAFIGSYLDPKSATSLATTSTKLQPHAEGRLWERLSVQSRDFVPADLNDPVCPPAVVVEGTTHTPLHRHDTSHDQGYTSALLLGKIIRDFNAKLDRFPWRAGMVRSLDLSLRHTVPSELVYLFARLSGSLKELHISMPHSAMVIPEIATYVPLTQVFSSVAAPFASLQLVRMRLQLEPGKLLGGLLSAAPRLKHLHLHNRYSPRLDGAGHVDPVLEGPRLLKATMLESLTVDHPATITTLLSALVIRSPTLRGVSLIDHTFTWSPSPGDALLSAVGSLETLTCLEIPCIAVSRLPDGFRNIQHATITWNAEALLQRDAAAVIIPPFPRLRTYQLDISLYMPRASFIHILRAAPHRQALSLLGEITPTHLAATPRLTTIHCPSHLDFQRARSASRPGIPNHTSHGFEGMILYSFVDESTGNELSHYRRHTSINDVPRRGRQCPVYPAGWHDQAWFRDRMVPADLLFAVYTAGGVDIKREQPERGKKMDQAGWGVLRYWYDGCSAY